MIYHNKKLLETCRLIECQVCGIDDGTVCAAHANSQQFNKGMGIKASDAMCASLCFKCHSELDNGHNLSREERVEMWTNAYIKTMRVLIERGLLVVA